MQIHNEVERFRSVLRREYYLFFSLVRKLQREGYKYEVAYTIARLEFYGEP